MVRYFLIIQFLIYPTISVSQNENQSALEIKLKKILTQNQQISSNQIQIEEHIYGVTQGSKFYRKQLMQLIKLFKENKFPNLAGKEIRIQVCNTYKIKLKNHKKNIIELYIPYNAAPIELITVLSKDPSTTTDFKKYWKKNLKLIDSIKINDNSSQMIKEWIKFLCNTKNIKNINNIKSIPNPFTKIEINDSQFGPLNSYRLLISSETTPDFSGSIRIDQTFPKGFSSSVLNLKNSNQKIEMTINYINNTCLIDQLLVENIEKATEINFFTGETIHYFKDNPKIRSLQEIYGKEGCYREVDGTLEPIIKLSNDIKPILVAILDSGIDYNHPGLAHALIRENKTTKQLIKIIQDSINELNKQNFEAKKKERILTSLNRFKDAPQRLTGIGWDFEDDDNKPFDFKPLRFQPQFTRAKGGGHGSHVSNLARKGDPRIKILPIRHYNHDKDSYQKNYDAIILAALRGARVVNMSFSSEEMNEGTMGIRDAIKDNPNMIFVAAAGNESKINEIRNIDIKPNYPAAFKFPNLITVANVDNNGKLANSSNIGPTLVDLAAEGFNVTSYKMGEGTQKYTGTSMAAPKVTKAVAKIFQINPLFSPAEVRKILCQSADGTKELIGKVRCGQLNEKKAIELAKKYLKQSSINR